MLGLKDGNKPGRGSIPRNATIYSLIKTINMNYPTETTALVHPTRFITYLFELPKSDAIKHEHRAFKPLIKVRMKGALNDKKEWIEYWMSLTSALNLYQRKLNQGFEDINKHIH